MSNLKLALCSLSLVLATACRSGAVDTPRSTNDTANETTTSTPVNPYDPAEVFGSGKPPIESTLTTEVTAVEVINQPTSAATVTRNILEILTARGIDGETGRLEHISAFTSSRIGEPTVSVEMNLDIYDDVVDASRTLDALMRDLARLDGARGVSLDRTFGLAERTERRGIHVRKLRVRFMPETSELERSAFDPTHAIECLFATAKETGALSSGLGVSARRIGVAPGVVDRCWKVKGGDACHELTSVNAFFSSLDDLGTDVAVTAVTLKQNEQTKKWSYSADVSYRTTNG